MFFFFNDTATTEIYTLSLHDALPISRDPFPRPSRHTRCPSGGGSAQRRGTRCTIDRKSTRLNSSHANISYAVFCLKKKIGVQHLLPGRSEDPNARQDRPLTRGDTCSE